MEKVMANGFAELSADELETVDGGKSYLEKACNDIGAAAHYTCGYVKDWRNFGTNWKIGFNSIFG